MKRATGAALAAAAALALAAGGQGKAADAPYVTQAVADVGRPPTDMALDAQRRPAEVLSFAGVRPGWKVAVIGDAHGYYGRILSKLVGRQGRVYEVAADVFGLSGGGNGPTPPPGQPQPAESPWADLTAIQNIAEYPNFVVLAQSMGLYGGNLALPEPVDAVIMVDADAKLRALYGRLGDGMTMAAADKAVFRAMKPGGVLVELAGVDEAAPRSDPATVKAELREAGFRPAGETGAALRFVKPASSPPDRRPPDAAMKPYFDRTFVLGTPDQRFRTIFYHPDHSYQEFGMHDMQSATWWFDADGHNCMLHEFPARDRGLVICHPFEAVHRAPPVGRPFLEHGGAGANAQMVVSVVPGHQYPNTATFPRPPAAAKP